VLGGSPGNYGILTHINLKPLHDKDYPHSRGMKMAVRFNKEKFEKVVQFAAEMNDDPNFPGDFDVNVQLTSSVFSTWYVKNKLLGVKRGLTRDEDMLLNHPEIYGSGVPIAEDARMSLGAAHPAVLQVWIQWANTGGENQKFGDAEKEVFEKYRKAMGPGILLKAEFKALSTLKHVAWWFGGAEDDSADLMSLSYHDHHTMSELNRYWIYEDPREFVMPFDKRSYISDRTNLSTNGWVKWAANHVDSVVNGPAEVKLSMQIQPFGGKFSKVRTNENLGSSHSWRNNATTWISMDSFYEVGPYAEKNNKELASEFGQQVDAQVGPDGVFSEKERRYLAFSFTKPSDPPAHNLELLWDKYYDSREKYDKLVDIKRRADPTGIFTPNKFCVGGDPDSCPYTIPLPDDQVIYRGRFNSEYKPRAYQYGTTSHVRGTMAPAAIVAPKSMEDIQKVVKFARDNKLAIAVRSGGHAYNGDSSTCGLNIQLDMAETFKDFEYNAETKLVRCGVSLSLLEFAGHMGERDLFIPHGICAHVHIGGHVQTGGYGEDRSHGLLCDYVEALEIVTADGNLRVVHRPVEGSPDQDNDDLYWAVLGGSPGNFGVLTHVTLRPLHDKDYPHSRGMKLTTLYSKEKFKKVAQIVAEMNDDDELPDSFSYAFMVFGDSPSSWYFTHHFKQKFHLKEKLSPDEEMMLLHGEDYGSGVPKAEEEKLDLPPFPVPLMQFWMQWDNTGGAEQEFTDEDAQVFERVRKVLEHDFLDAVLEGHETLVNVTNWVKRLFGGDRSAENPSWLWLDYKKHTPVSKLIQYRVWRDVREYVMPFEKRAYFSEKADLSTNGYVDWVVKTVDKALRSNDGFRPALQFLPIGGSKSMIRRAKVRNQTSHSWREVVNTLLLIDAFYDANDPKAQEAALEFGRINDTQAGPGGLLSEYDRRVLAYSYARADDPDGGAQLDSVWDKYYDSEEKYNKLVALKKKFDPHGVFTANAFCVGKTNAPRIYGNGHQPADC